MPPQFITRAPPASDALARMVANESEVASSDESPPVDGKLDPSGGLQDCSVVWTNAAYRVEPNTSGEESNASSQNSISAILYEHNTKNNTLLRSVGAQWNQKLICTGNESNSDRRMTRGAASENAGPAPGRNTGGSLEARSWSSTKRRLVNYPAFRDGCLSEDGDESMKASSEPGWVFGPQRDFEMDLITEMEEEETDKMLEKELITRLATLSRRLAYLHARRGVKQIEHGKVDAKVEYAREGYVSRNRMHSDQEKDMHTYQDKDMHSYQEKDTPVIKREAKQGGKSVHRQLTPKRRPAQKPGWLDPLNSNDPYVRSKLILKPSLRESQGRSAKVQHKDRQVVNTSKSCDRLRLKGQQPSSKMQPLSSKTQLENVKWKSREQVGFPAEHGKARSKEQQPDLFRLRSRQHSRQELSRERESSKEKLPPGSKIQQQRSSKYHQAGYEKLKQELPGESLKIQLPGPKDQQQEEQDPQLPDGNLKFQEDQLANSSKLLELPGETESSKAEQLEMLKSREAAWSKLHQLSLKELESYKRASRLWGKRYDWSGSLRTEVDKSILLLLQPRSGALLASRAAPLPKENRSFVDERSRSSLGSRKKLPGRIFGDVSNIQQKDYVSVYSKKLTR